MRPGAAAATTYRIFQKINGFKVCLDASFEFSVCQTSPNPDDPPAVQKWQLIPGPNGTDLIKNGSDCLDLRGFTAPCSSGDAKQQWVRVALGHGRDMVVNRSTSPSTCLDSTTTFKTCSLGSKQQTWTFAHKL